MNLTGMNLTGVILYIDTHIIDAADEAAEHLRRLGAEGWVSLQRTDTMDTELASAPGDKLTDLLSASSEYPETLGPFVFNQSRFDHAVFGTEDDETRLQQVFAILFPGADRNTARKNHIRDSMHVATAIRYGGYGFVTHEKRLLSKSQAIASAFQGFKILDPEAAATEVMDRVRTTRELHRLEPERGSLPSWP